jgi:hypothetical protein
MPLVKSTLPSRVDDTLLHLKNNDREEIVILPITRYANVMSAPGVVGDSDEIPGAPFHLLALGTEEMSVEEIRKYCGGII